MNTDYDVIYGEGKGGGGSTPTEADDTLSSKQTLRVLYALSNGPIEGVTSIYLNGTKLAWIPEGSKWAVTPDDIMLADESKGRYSIAGVFPDYRKGLPTQSSMKGFTFEESINANTALLLTKQTEFTANFTSDVDASRVILTLEKLVYIDSDGNSGIFEVKFKFEVRVPSPSNPAVFVTAYEKTVSKKGKSSGRYSFDTILNKPEGAGSWSIKITRLTDNDREDKITPTDRSMSTSSISAVSSIVYKDLSYDGVALIGMTFTKANRFNNNFPEIIFRVHGITVPVPNTYNKITGTYSAIPPGGTWTWASKDLPSTNPAWQLLYLYRNSEYGLGIEDSMIDLNTFYEFGMYCDEQMSNVIDGLNVTEKRYTFSNHFTEREEAAKFLMYFYTVANARPIINKYGLHSVTWDRRRDASKIVTNSNVIDGVFDYSSSSIEQRYSSVNIIYNNGDNLGKTTTVTVSDEGLLNRYGFRSVDIPLVGCYSKAQAIRKGRWTLFRNGYMVNILTFRLLFDALYYEVGDIVKVMDDMRCENVSQGVITKFTDSYIYFDRGIELYDDVSYISYYTQNGIRTRSISRRSQTITYLIRNSSDPDPIIGTSFIISGAVKEQLWEVVGLSYDTESKVTAVSLVEYNPSLYDYIEGEIFEGDSPLYSGIDESFYNCPEVENVVVGLESYEHNNVINYPSNRSVLITWDWFSSSSAKSQYESALAAWMNSDKVAPKPVIKAFNTYDPSFEVGYRKWNSGLDYVLLEHISTMSVTIPKMSEGKYDFSIKAINTVGRQSSPVILSEQDVKPVDLKEIVIETESLISNGISTGFTSIFKRYEIEYIEASAECKLALFTTSETSYAGVVEAVKPTSIDDSDSDSSLSKVHLSASSKKNFEISFSADELTVTFDEPIKIKQYTASSTATGLKLIRSPYTFYQVTNLTSSSKTIKITLWCRTLDD